MGSFDRFLRKSAYKAYRSPRPIWHKTSKHAAPAKDAIVELPKNQKHQQLEFGSGVFTMMQSETEDLLRQKNPCTSYDLALALQQSEAVRDSIRLDKLLEDSTASTSHRAHDPYKILSLLLTKAQTEPRRTKISSWPQAQAWLGSHLQVIPRVGETQVEQNKSSLETFRLLVEKNSRKIIQKFRIREFSARALSQSLPYYRTSKSGPELEALEEKEELAYQAALKASDESRIPPAVKEADEREKEQERQEEAERIASSLLRPLTDKEQDVVEKALYGSGPSSEVLASTDSGDVVVRESMRRLQPGQWLNDEVIHYFMIMLAKRDELLSKLDPARPRSHFFKSFFITKLLNEGHANPNLDGAYEYRNVKRWSKKVPGKDIFKLDKIIIPINQGNAHWICGVIFMRERRIQIYDSLGGGGRVYLEALLRYVQDEHLDKKKEPLPNKDEWKCISTTRDTPRQKNGFDCGVFTCMFADFLSKDCPLIFSQEHITQCRERIGLSIMNGSALM